MVVYLSSMISIQKPDAAGGGGLPHDDDDPPSDFLATPCESAKSDMSVSARAVAASHGQPAYLNGLNPEQREAVETTEGLLLVLAGAGTGKTRVLTTRVAHILATGRAYPSQILAVTFTNKAAREMCERIGSLIGSTLEGMQWLGTFHSIGVKILRRHVELVDLKPGFTILDDDDQVRLLKQVIESADIDKNRWAVRQLVGLIDGWKNRGLTPDKIPEGESLSFAAGKGAKIYAAYQARLKELNACDFGDLLLECIRLFRQHSDILADYHRRFRYVLVDEYQDTNVAQYLLLRLLAQGSPNICCVGDDDQSIYGWRGAEVDNILRFEKDFPGAKVIRLERNYRSTANILAAASGLITKNTDRLGKTLFTDGAVGAKINVANFCDDEAEARAIGEDIENLYRAHNPLNEIAILVRASSQMRAIEDRFIRLGLPYRVIGGPRFYERQEIKDAIAYLDVVANPANDLKFERIVNVPKRGLGEATIKRIHELARTRVIPLYQAAREIVETNGLTPKAKKSLLYITQSFERWRANFAHMRHTDLANHILDESGYTAMWRADKNLQSQSRLEGLKELVRFMHDFDTLQDFLEHVSLVMDADQGSDSDRVSLMTLHAAKGLEFGIVFLPGWEEGLFPHQRSLDESGKAGLEEERRLAYVGLTRARRRAKISFTQNRRIHGLYQAVLPSRFVDELPKVAVEVVKSAMPCGGWQNPFGFGGESLGPSRFSQAAGVESFKANYKTPDRQRLQQSWSSNSSQKSQKMGSRGSMVLEGKLVTASTSNALFFKSGVRVRHGKFGLGTVTNIDSNKLTIDFDDGSTKCVVASFVDVV